MLHPPKPLGQDDSRTFKKTACVLCPWTVMGLRHEVFVLMLIPVILQVFVASSVLVSVYE